VPVSLLSPWYLILTAGAGLSAVLTRTLASTRFQLRLLPIMASFALPWYAAVGASKALDAGLPNLGAIVVGVITAVTGRLLLALISGVPPQHFVRGEWFVGTAILCSILYVICFRFGLALVPATLISCSVGFCFRLLAMSQKWEEPEPLQSTIH